jgi:hypothetical protein
MGRDEQEETKKLAEQAAEIARVINEDFEAFRQRVIKARATAVGGSDSYKPEPSGHGDEDDLIFGDELLAEIAVPTGGPGRGDGPAQPKGDSPRNFAPIVTEAGPNSEKKGRKGGGTSVILSLQDFR